MQGTLTLHRSQWSEPQQEAFQQLVDADDFYRLRIPSRPEQAESPPVIASLRARCLVKDGFQARAVSGITYPNPNPASASRHGAAAAGLCPLFAAVQSMCRHL